MHVLPRNCRVMEASEPWSQQAAWQALLALRPRLRRFASGLTGSLDEADDLVQAVYERAVAIPQRALSESELRHWYATLPDAVLRVKGWVQLEDQGSGLPMPAVVQGVGRRLEITLASPGALPQDAQLVLLGLAGCLRGVAAPDGSALVRA